MCMELTFDRCGWAMKNTRRITQFKNTNQVTFAPLYDLYNCDTKQIFCDLKWEIALNEVRQFPDRVFNGIIMNSIVVFRRSIFN